MVIQTRGVCVSPLCIARNGASEPVTTLQPQPISSAPGRPRTPSTQCSLGMCNQYLQSATSGAGSRQGPESGHVEGPLPEGVRVGVFETGLSLPPPLSWYRQLAKHMHTHTLARGVLAEGALAPVWGEFSLGILGRAGRVQSAGEALNPSRAGAEEEVSRGRKRPQERQEGELKQCGPQTPCSAPQSSVVHTHPNTQACSSLARQTPHIGPAPLMSQRKGGLVSEAPRPVTAPPSGLGASEPLS